MSTSSTSLALSLGALALAACSSVLGITETIADTDGDGIADEVDNCVEVPNPSQFDSDGDGIGDACATCAAPIGKDFDHDGYDDHCDRCIGAPTGVDSDGDGIDDGCETCVGGHGTTGVDVAPHDGVDDGCTFCRDPGGTDVDADGLDDACDSCLLGPPHDEDGDAMADACDSCPGGHTPELVHTCQLSGRVLFDPFVIERPANWATSQPAGWTVQDDALHLDSPTAELQRFSTAIPTGQLTVTIKLERGPVGTKGHVGVEIATPPPGFAFAPPPAGGTPTGPVRCELEADGHVTTSGPTAGKLTSPGIVDVTQPIWLTFSVRDGITLLVECTATTADGMSAQVGTEAISGLPVSLVVQGQVDVDWFDVVSGPL